MSAACRVTHHDSYGLALIVGRLRSGRRSPQKKHQQPKANLLHGTSRGLEESRINRCGKRKQGERFPVVTHFGEPISFHLKSRNERFFALLIYESFVKVCYSGICIPSNVFGQMSTCRP
jgi:hypothetical protein